MKIGFPVLKKARLNELEFDLNLHSSKFFGVFDSTNQSISILNTSSICDEGKGMDLIKFLDEENICCVISPEFHSMAARFFQNNNIQVYKANNMHVLTNINLFQQNKLVPYGAAQALQKSACSSSCSSCSATCNENIQDIVAI